MVCGALVPSVGGFVVLGPAVAVASWSPCVLLSIFHPIPSTFSSLWLIIFATHFWMWCSPTVCDPCKIMFRLPGVGTIDTAAVMKPVSYSQSVHAFMSSKVSSFHKTLKQTCMCRPKDQHDNAHFCYGLHFSTMHKVLVRLL